jgi:hypothetical protein
MPNRDVGRMSVAGEIEQLFEDGEVRSPMSASGKAGEQIELHRRKPSQYLSGHCRHARCNSLNLKG